MKLPWRRREEELDEEIEGHLRMAARERVERGETPEQAAAAARREFGNVGLVKEVTRGMWGFVWLRQLMQDLRYGLRTMRRGPGFTAVAVLTLALGIGVNTSIFQLIDAVRLRALPVPEPQQLTEIRIEDMKGARGNFASWHPALSNPVWEQVRERQQGFSGVFAWGAADFNLGTGSEVRPARGLWVSGDFFNVLGVRPELGRVFVAGDDRRGCGAVGAVISHQFWQREFGGDPSVVGKTLSLDDHTFEVVGVTPASFYGPEVGRAFDVAVPVCSEALISGAENSQLDTGTTWWLIVMGRLKPGWTIEQATAQLNSISPGVFEATLSPKYPAESTQSYLNFKLAAYPAAGGISQVRENYESPLWMLLGVAGLVLLVACANLANLLLARANAREREIAVRLALGASRSRVVRQLLAESLLLAVVGSALGALLSGLLSQSLISLLSTGQDRLFLDLSTDWPVLGFTAGMAVLTCALFGLTPALRASRVAPTEAMKSSGRGLTAGRERLGLRRALVVAQVALSLVLVAGALLFSRSLGKLLAEDVGFRQEGVLIAQVDSSRMNLPEESRLPFKRGLLERIKAVPGVKSAAATNVVLLSGNAWGNDVWMDGAASSERKPMNLARVTPGFFDTLGITMLGGRDFDDRDNSSSPNVAVVNEEFARQVAGGGNPVGSSFWVEARPGGVPETRYEIVGLVKSTKYSDLREELQPVVYFPMSQATRFGQFDQILISSNAPLAQLTDGVRRAVGEVSPQSTIQFQVLREQVLNTLARDRLIAILSGLFGLLALVLACVGLYGLVSYGVASRTHEIGIRLALGAQPRDVRLMILRESLLLVAVGLAVGLPATLAATRLASAFLFGLSPADPVSLSIAVFALLAAALAAGYIPALRATKIDPLIALRYE
jgi:predicted permease